MLRRRRQGQVGRVPSVVVGDSRPALPRRLAEVDAGASARGGKVVPNGGGIPDRLRNVRQRGASGSAIDGSPKVLARAIVELSAAHARDLRYSGGKAGARSLGDLGGGSGEVARARAPIAGRRHPRDPLRVGLLRDRAKPNRTIRLATSVAEADEGRQVLVDRVLNRGR